MLPVPSSPPNRQSPNRINPSSQPSRFNSLFPASQCKSRGILTSLKIRHNHQVQANRGFLANPSLASPRFLGSPRFLASPGFQDSPRFPASLGFQGSPGFQDSPDFRDSRGYQDSRHRPRIPRSLKRRQFSSRQG